METHSVFNDLDYIVTGIVLLSGLLALMRGFVRELFSLIAWAGACFVAAKFYAPAIPWAHHYVKNDKVAEWAAMAMVFVATLVVLTIVGHFMCSHVKGRAVTFINRSFGFLYGLARGALVVCLLYLAAVMILWPDIDASSAQQDKDRNAPPELLLDAKTRPLLAYGADMLKAYVPSALIDKTLKNADGHKEDVEKAAQKVIDAAPTPEDGSGNAPAFDKILNQESKP
ncbi:MAG: CvpA family protein [Alphaproteobacteria bacterium]|nr:CvpA family protein [Alphaproteobacteria bacterium]